MDIMADANNRRSLAKASENVKKSPSPRSSSSASAALLALGAIMLQPAAAARTRKEHGSTDGVGPSSIWSKLFGALERDAKLPSSLCVCESSGRAVKDIAYGISSQRHEGSIVGERTGIGAYANIPPIAMKMFCIVIITIISVVAQRVYSKKRFEQSRQLQTLEESRLEEQNATEKYIFTLQLDAILEKKAYAVGEELQTEREMKLAKEQMERKVRERRRREMEDKSRRR